MKGRRILNHLLGWAVFAGIVVCVVFAARWMVHRIDAFAEADMQRRPAQIQVADAVYQKQVTPAGRHEYVKYYVPRNLGHGVYLFVCDYAGADWQHSLAKFVGDHPELRVTAIGIGAYGSGITNTGPASFLVVTEHR